MTANPKNFRQTSGLAAGARLIAVYVRRHPRPFTIAVFGAIVFALATIAWSWAFGRIVEEVVRPFFNGENPESGTAFLALIAIAMLRAIAGVLRRSNAGVHRLANAATWHEMVVDQLLAQPVSFFRRQSTGDLLAAADSDVDASVTVLAPLPYSLGVLVLLIASVIWMLSVDIVLGLVGAIAFPVLLVGNRIFEEKVEAPTERVQAGVAVLAGRTHEMVDGFGAVKALGLEEIMRSRLDEQISVVTAAKVDAMRIRVAFEAGQNLFIPVINVLAILLGAVRVKSGAMSVGELVSLLVLISLMAWPLRLLGWALSDLPKSVAGMRRLDVMLSTPPPAISVTPVPEASANVVELRSVSVVHDDGRVALDGIDLDIRFGEILAIVGPTGSGKSTLLDVICGIERPATGVRRLDGSLTATDIIMVFQEPVVLNGTIESNLLLGNPSARSLGHSPENSRPDRARPDRARPDRSGLDRALLERALTISEASDFIAAFPLGLATEVGERGVTLSGGQRQRLALARALARRPALLLLDDTTSSLDAATEERVLQRIAEEGTLVDEPDEPDEPDGRAGSGGLVSTMVIVAARPAAITFADRIVVLNEGKIVAIGTHTELLESSALYAELIAALASHVGL